MTRPVIGITAYREPARWRHLDEPAVLIPDRYVSAVLDAGGLPVVIPPDAAVAGRPLDVVRRLDALVISGGPDIAPARYGARRHPRTEPSWPVRDESELALARAAADADLPLLGICRGMQVMVVAAGGSLHQHLPDVVGDDRHRPDDGATHPLRCVPGSLAARILGTERAVSSDHHQGVADPVTLHVTGRVDDGTIEVVEDPSRAFMLGVQWHAERDDDRAVLHALVESAGG